MHPRRRSTLRIRSTRPRSLAWPDYKTGLPLVSVSVCPHSRSRISWLIFTKTGTDVCTVVTITPYSKELLQANRNLPFKFFITSFFTEPGLHWSRFGVVRLNPLLPVTDPKFDRKYSFPMQWFSSMSMEFSSILSIVMSTVASQQQTGPITSVTFKRS